MAETTDRSAAAPSFLDFPRGRRRVLAFALAVLVIQLVVPLTYYLGDDRYDERFAWRMFSAERMHDCRSRAVEVVTAGGHKRARLLALDETVHQAWVSQLERNRRPVVRRFLEWRCEQAGVSEVRLVNRCVAADRTPLPPRQYAIDCASGAVREPTQPGADETAGDAAGATTSRATAR